jgi:hypothetical protein
MGDEDDRPGWAKGVENGFGIVGSIIGGNWGGGIGLGVGESLVSQG